MYLKLRFAKTNHLPTSINQTQGIWQNCDVKYDVEPHLLSRVYVIYRVLLGRSHESRLLEIFHLEEIVCEDLDSTCWAAATCWRWFIARRFFYPEDGGDTILQNVGSHKKLHGATSQKMTFFIVTAVKTANLTYIYVLFPCFTPIQ
jgi:hypothetical protein